MATITLPSKFRVLLAPPSPQCPNRSRGSWKPVGALRFVQGSEGLTSYYSGVMSIDGRDYHIRLRFDEVGDAL